MADAHNTIHCHDLGLIEYSEALRVQEYYLHTAVQHKLQNNTPAENHLLFCEHPNVYTLGKSGNEANLLASSTQLQNIDAQYFQTNRGGDITYHGPGQLIAYPVIDLENFFTDIHKYMRSLEEVVIRTCTEIGIQTGRVSGATGVWVAPESNNPRKICAMGVKTSRWVTMHGFALNINTDLKYFDYIIPCGLTGKKVTSMAAEKGHEVDTSVIKLIVMANFASVFGAKLM